QGEVGANRGDDALPYSRDDLRDKFMALTGRVWPTAHAEQVLEATLDLAAGNSAFDAWVKLLRRAPS
ncbi:MAG: hypothetical protein ABIR55_13135, partial [Burkholderiaceae bacterium]